jgi:hypothetical protein
MWWGSKFIIREMQTFHIFIFIVFVPVIDGKLWRQLKIAHAIFASPPFHLGSGFTNVLSVDPADLRIKRAQGPLVDAIWPWCTLPFIDVVVLVAMLMVVMIMMLVMMVVASGRVVALEPIDEVGRHHDVAAGLVGGLAVVGGVVADLVGPRHQFAGDVLHVGLHVHPITPTW